MRDRGGIVTERTLGEAWLEVAGRILSLGRPGEYDGLAMHEIERITIEVEAPDPHDRIIAGLADPERLSWMHANFTDHARVVELGGAASYASRLYDYSRTGRDQVAWVIDRLKSDPTTRSASVTTFEPLSDTAYIPCVSLLDFWMPDSAVELIAYCHSIDFGTKGYGNLVELARLQAIVAAGVGVPVGRLTMVVKSAHIYATETEFMASLRVDDVRATSLNPAGSVQ